MKHSIMCGSFRSGTSICSIIVSKHSEVIYTDELWTYKNTVTVNKKIEKLNNRFPNLVGRPFINKQTLGNGYQNFLNEWKKSKVKNSNDLIQRLLKHSDKDNIKIVGDKVPEYVFNLLTLDKSLNKPKFIMCIRDGRDVIQSQISRYNYFMKLQGHTRPHFWTHSTVEDCISDWRSWFSYMSAWDTNKKNLDYYEIYYPKLVKNPEIVGSELAEFLGVNKEEMSKLFKETINPKKHEAWKKDFPELNSKLPEKWKEMLLKYGFEI